VKRLFARIAAFTALALIVLLGALLAVLPSASEDRASSVYSRAPDGLRVLFLTSEALGFPVSAWSAAPGALDGRGSLLVLGAAPEEPPPGPGARPGPSSAAPARSRDLAHYGRFLDAGGRYFETGLIC
jgi:hypothetical protein